MKISAKTIAIGISTLVVVGGSVAYYLLTNESPETLGWMSSSWLYRKGVTVANAGSTLVNEDVLIEVNTAALVTTGKLQSDCDDLRFTDSDETTAIAYWIEGGCNTTTTQIWARIPSLPSGGKTIYMYYGNSAASSSEETWTSGSFTMMYNSTCPTGWTRRADLDSNFPYGATTSGTTGGNSSHGHGAYAGSTSGNAGIFQTISGATTVSSNYHSHSGVSITVNTNASVLPAYRDMVFCSKSKLDVSSGLISIFESTPTGWTRFSALDSVIPRGASSYGGTGGADTHSHTTTGSSTSGPNGTASAGGTGCSAGSSGHTHSISAASTAAGSNLPPYLSVIFASADSATYGVDDMITMVNSVPPLGWTQFSALNSKYPRGASSYGATSGTETHTHSYSQGMAAGSSSSVQCSGTGTYVGTGSGHNFIFSTGTYNNHPPYLTTVYAQRKVSTSATVGAEEEENSPPSDWMNSSWLYRMEVTVPNTGSTLTDEEVLMQVNTATLVTAGKLQSDCDDLRVTDSDGTTPISYWVEGGCNTATTQIWTEIPSLPTGGKVIYLYYGNSSATNAELSWSGNFILLADASCPTGWTRNTAFDSKFAYGATSYGTSSGNATHNHGGSISATSGAASVSSGTGGDPPNSECSNWPTATHPVSGVIGAENNTPPYISTLFCGRSKLTDIGALTLFSDNSTPTGWTRQTAFDGKFPYGSSTYGTTGGSTTHTHTLSSLANSASAQACEDIDPPNPNSRPISQGSHTHSTVTINSNSSASSLPPYKVLLYVEAPSSTATLNETLIAMTTVNPPLGWTQYSATNNYFIQGGSTANLTAQGSSTHTHSATFTLGGTSASMSRNASSMLMAYGGTHTHSVSYTTPSASATPPYLSVIYSKKNTSISTTVGEEEIDNEAPTAPTALLTEGATNPNGIADTTPEFSAIFNDPNTGDTGVFYQIQVNTAADFTGTTMWDSTLTAMTPTAIGARSPDISYAGTTLTFNGATYYWAIKFADNDSATSPWSATASFVMDGGPFAPTGMLTDGLTNPTRILSATPSFSAIHTDPNNDNASAYQIQVNTNNTFTGTVMWDSTKTATSVTNNTRSSNYTYAGTTLPNENTTYYWRIKFWDVEDYEGAWSAAAQFSSLQTSFLFEGLNMEGIQLN